MKTLSEILLKGKEINAELIQSISRYKKNGDHIRACWGSSCYADEIFGADNAETQLTKRQNVRDISLPQWTDNCEIWISYINKGYNHNEFSFAKPRCDSCYNAYSKNIEKINRFYNAYGKLPTLIWDKNGLTFKEETEKEKVIKEKEKPTIDYFSKSYVDYEFDKFVSKTYLKKK